jgi:hypothetical protein
MTRAPASIQSEADRAYAAWRKARGLDAASGPFALPSGAPFARKHPGSAAEDTSWQAGFGLPIPDGVIKALLPFGGKLIVGGNFSRIGDLEVNGLAAWDGNNWSTLGAYYPGLDARELEPYLGGLLALGYPLPWRWDGSEWSLLGTPSEWSDYGIDMAVREDQVALLVVTYDLGRE